MWLFKKKQQPPPLCKDCKYVECDWISFYWARCVLEDAEINLQTGEVKHELCSIERGVYGTCGKKGRFFTKKEVA